MADQTPQTRLEVMDSTTRSTAKRAVLLGWYGSVTGILLGISIQRYRRIPQLMCIGIGIGSGVAFWEGNEQIKQKLETKE